MSLSITSQGALQTSAPTLATSAFTPSAGAIIVVSYFGFFDSAGTASISDTFGDSGGGSWVPFTNAFLTTTGAFQGCYGGWTRLIGTGASSGTVGISASGFTGGENTLCVDEVTTSSGTLSVAQTNCATANFSATGSVTLGSSPSATSLVWSSAECGQTGLTPDVTTSGFTALDNTNANAELTNATAYIIGSGPATIAWSGLSGGQQNTLTAVEIAVTAGPAFIAPRALVVPSNQAVMAASYL